MNPSPKQDEALRAVGEWLSSNPTQPFYLAGYAGTGKTTLASHFAEGVSGRVYFAAYTNKAAHVLRQKGCTTARTIHSLIYLPRGKDFRGYEAIERRVAELSLVPAEQLPDKEVIELSTLRRELEKLNEELKSPAFHLNTDSELRGASLLIVDECSMIDRNMGEDLLSFQVPILVLGDPAQLPPVRGTGYFTSREPDYLLTEIHRQAKDNPILHIADLVRRGERVPPGQYGDSVVTRKIKVVDALDQADQILVGTNKTRRYINAQGRSHLLKASNSLPMERDRLVCLQNNMELGLMNGSLWRVGQVGECDDMVCSLRVDSDDGLGSVWVRALRAFFEGREQELQYYEMGMGHKFDYGYALTVHKAQGSQWDRVVVLDEASKFPDRGDFARQWRYTAVTRAAKRLDYVVKEG